MTAPGAASPPRAVRVPIAAPVGCRWGAIGDFFPEYASDVSTSGVFIRSPAPRPVGTLVFLQVALQESARTVEALGRVARIGRDSGGEPGMGVQFLTLDDESRALVDQLVAVGRR